MAERKKFTSKMIENKILNVLQSYKLRSLYEMGSNQISLVQKFTTYSINETLFSNECLKLSNDLKSGQTTIMTIVEQLGPLLIDTSPDIREKGTLVLSQILEKIPPDLLTAAQVNYISTFYSERLNDHHQVVPAVLRGLIPLVKYSNITNSSIIQLLSCLFQNVVCQQQQQSDRYNIYLLLKTLVSTNPEVIRIMGLDFVYGVISAIDGERDPRNLMFLFSILPEFLRIVTLGHLSEEMFEVMACYFPVDFRVPTKDVNNISRDELAASLAPCLCATPSFSTNVIALIFEKLNSEHGTAKVDSLDLIIESCKTFPVEAYIPYSNQLCSVIQEQIFHNTDTNIETKSFEALTCLFRKLSESDCCLKTLNDLADTLKGNFNPNSLLFEPTLRIFISISVASEKLSLHIIEKILPILINLYTITTTVFHQIIIFKSIITLAKVHMEFKDNTYLKDVKGLEMILTMCLRNVLSHENDIQVCGLQSIAGLAKYIDHKMRCEVYQNLLQILLVPLNNTVRKNLLCCFQTFATRYPEEISKVIDELQPNSVSTCLYLEVVGSVADNMGLVEKSLHILKKYSTLKYFEIATSSSALGVITNLLISNGTLVHSFLIQVHFMNDLIDWFLDISNEIDQETNMEFLEIFSNILCLLVRPLSVVEQSTLVNVQLAKVFSIYEKFHNDIILIAVYGLTISLHKDTSIKFNLREVLYDVLLLTKSSYINKLCSQLLGNISNKLVDVEVDVTIKQIEKILTLRESKETCEHNVNTVIYITKALILRGHYLGETWMLRMLEMAKRHDEVCLSFQIIVNDKLDCISLENYSNIRPLYKQKFFSQLIAIITKDGLESVNEKHLMIFGYTLRDLPRQIILMEFKKIITLIIRCLEDCFNPDVICTILDLLCELVENKNPFAEQYFEEFLKRFLQLSTFKNSMKVRLLALKGVQHYAVGYPLYQTLPSKQNVIRALASPLDDPKRLVRKEAVEARSRWFLIDSPM